MKIALIVEGKTEKNNDLGIAVGKCPELKALVNTILSICGSA